MSRKASVIMTAAERKQAGADLANEIKAVKQDLKDANTALKDAEKKVKELTKNRDAIAKVLTGLETRKAALNPPKPILNQATVAA